ncbi:MAG: hypothetical protein NC212_10980 [Staphylococcus sp.]|nr:hypothetical protein [Staphylococcus sp.]
MRRITIVALIVFTMVSCSTQKELHKESAMESAAVDTSVIDSGHDVRHDGWWWLSWVCDSVGISLRADSVVSADGSKIYNPVIETSAAAPRIEAAAGESSGEAYSIHAEASHSMQTEATTQTNEQRETVAVAEPPSIKWWWVAGIAAAIIAVVAWIRNKY